MMRWLELRKPVGVLRATSHPVAIGPSGLMTASDAGRPVGGREPGSIDP
jgi:hypothetical protein